MSINVDFDGLYNNEYTAFDMYFGSICSMQVHPGAGTKDHKVLSIEECKDMAMEMLKIRRRVGLITDAGGSPCLGQF